MGMPAAYVLVQVRGVRVQDKGLSCAECVGLARDVMVLAELLGGSLWMQLRDVSCKVTCRCWFCVRWRGLSNSVGTTDY